MTSIENFAESIGILYVQFINGQLNLNEFQLEFNKEYQQAKEVHKNEIENAYSSGRFDYEDYVKGIKLKVKQSKEYYQQVYDKTNG